MRVDAETDLTPHTAEEEEAASTTRKCKLDILYKALKTEISPIPESGETYSSIRMMVAGAQAAGGLSSSFSLKLERVFSVHVQLPRLPSTCRRTRAHARTHAHTHTYTHTHTHTHTHHTHQHAHTHTRTHAHTHTRIHTHTPHSVCSDGHRVL